MTAEARSSPEREPYRVEVEREGCEHCGDGKQWEVYDADGVGVGGMTFGCLDDAEHLAEMLNDAYGAGGAALRAQVQALIEENEKFRKWLQAREKQVDDAAVVIQRYEQENERLKDIASERMKGWNEATGVAQALEARLREVEAALAAEQDTARNDPAEQRAERYALEASDLAGRLIQVEAERDEANRCWDDVNAIVQKQQAQIETLATVVREVEQEMDGYCRYDVTGNTVRRWANTLRAALPKEGQP